MITDNTINDDNTVMKHKGGRAHQVGARTCYCGARTCYCGEFDEDRCQNKRKRNAALRYSATHYHPLGHGNQPKP